MNNTNPPEGSAAAVALAAAATASTISGALRAALARDTLAAQAEALGFERGVALQVAQLAFDHAEATGLTPAQCLLSLAQLHDAESRVTRIDAVARRWGAGWAARALSAACNAVRHAAEFARRPLLRR